MRAENLTADTPPSPSRPARLCVSTSLGLPVTWGLRPVALLSYRHTSAVALVQSIIYFPAVLAHPVAVSLTLTGCNLIKGDMLNIQF